MIFVRILQMALSRFVTYLGVLRPREESETERFPRLFTATRVQLKQRLPKLTRQVLLKLSTLGHTDL